jgi:hypothetical protein
MPRSNAPWAEHARDLLQSVGDVAPADHPPAGGIGAAGAPHQRLFSAYVQKLRAAKKVAEIWWNATVESYRTSGRRGARDEALRTAKEIRPLGARCDSNFIGLLRQYWFECLALNASVDPEQRVAPEYFLLAWLIETGEDELAEFISGLTYWPIGQDKKGRWV